MSDQRPLTQSDNVLWPSESAATRRAPRWTAPRLTDGGFSVLGTPRRMSGGRASMGSCAPARFFPVFLTVRVRACGEPCYAARGELQDALNDRPADAEPADDDVGGLRPRETDQRRSFRTRLAETSEQIAIVGEYAVASRREGWRLFSRDRSGGRRVFFRLLKPKSTGIPKLVRPQRARGPVRLGARVTKLVGVAGFDGNQSQYSIHPSQLQNYLERLS